MDPIVDDLNPAQRQAVEHGEGALMVVAGAGSGKTRVITRRVARLLRDGEDSDAILALTFTNKAAGEMARRVQQLGGRRVHVATFHSACARFLRRDAELLDYPRDYTIYDTYDRDTCIKMLMEERGMALAPIRPGHVGAEISRLKNLQVDIAEYRETAPLRADYSVPAIVAELWEPYHERMRKLGAMDFDDLLGRFLELLVRFPAVAARYQERFRWILVDEFQDTNRVQYELIKVLAAGHRNPCVVGDPDQSIYRFRGAEIGNILGFARDFPGARVVRLETNYRSTRRILQAAQGVIVHNEERLERDLATDNADGDKLVYRRFDSPFDENEAVGRRIRDLVGRGGAAPDQVAVFYRSHFLSRGLEEVLRRLGVPYEVVGGLSFYERREIKDLLAYLRVVINPLDDVSLGRIVNVPPRKIGEATIAKMRALAARAERSLFELLQEPALCAELPKAAQRGLVALAGAFAAVKAAGEQGAAEAVRALLDATDYVAHAARLGDPQDVTREENIDELVADAADFDVRFGGGLPAYLAHVSLLTSEDRAMRQGPTVSLMTVHAAKGLEFDHVFVVGLEDGLFPSSRAEEDGDLEEERRLMYVALTRARQSVHLSGCDHRMVQGRASDQVPSRFLAEIPDDCLERDRRPDARRDVWRRHEPEPAEPPEPPSLDGIELQPGTRVVHPVYGAGVVVRLSGRGFSARAVVRFDDEGERTLVLEYARLELAAGDRRW